MSLGQRTPFSAGTRPRPSSSPSRWLASWRAANPPPSHRTGKKGGPEEGTRCPRIAPSTRMGKRRVSHKERKDHKEGRVWGSCIGGPMESAPGFWLPLRFVLLARSAVQPSTDCPSGRSSQLEEAQAPFVLCRNQGLGPRQSGPANERSFEGFRTASAETRGPSAFLSDFGFRASDLPHGSSIPCRPLCGARCLTSAATGVGGLPRGCGGSKGQGPLFK